MHGDFGFDRAGLRLEGGREEYDREEVVERMRSAVRGTGTKTDDRESATEDLIKAQFGVREAMVFDNSKILASSVVVVKTYQFTCNDFTLIAVIRKNREHRRGSRSFQKHVDSSMNSRNKRERIHHCVGVGQ